MLFLDTRSSTCPTRGQRDQKASNGLLSIVESGTRHHELKQEHLKGTDFRFPRMIELILMF